MKSENPDDQSRTIQQAPNSFPSATSSAAPDESTSSSVPSGFPSDSGTIAQAPDGQHLSAIRSIHRSQTFQPTGYENLGELGRGGMGVVFKARHLALKRTVALKMMLAGGHASAHDLARFRVEAEAVARLIHPNIVQIFEVGEADGHPYCALELVEGGSLAQKLGGRPQPAKEAAKLVETLARAMQFAHSRNVIHRDLKPSNVLLTPEGELKVTDFGLARQLDTDSGETQAGSIMGTPSYMAPEQASGQSHEAGPAADIYAIGAILYECLTGRPPFKADTVIETLDQVRSWEPLAPSRWHAGVPLDLDTICLKCLRKEPERRYASAAELADELVRYQVGEPILARPMGRVERAVRLLRRNPIVTGAALSVMVALATGATVSYRKYLDAEEQKGIANEKRKEAEKLREIAEERRQEAEEQTQTAQAVSQFLGGLFEDASPIAITGRMFGTQLSDDGVMTALDVVDRGAAKLKTELKDNPVVRAVLLDRIGRVYLDLGRPVKAQPLLEEALRIRLELNGPDNLDYANGLQGLGLLYMSQNQSEPAIKYLEEALALRRKHLGDGDLLVADTLWHLGATLVVQSEHERAEKLLRECLKIRRARLSQENREIAAALFILGQSHLVRDDFATALPLLREAADMADKLNGKKDFSGIVGLYLQAQLAESIGQVSIAKKLFAEANEKGTKLMGENHFLVSIGRNHIAQFLMKHGDFATAAKMFQSVVAINRRIFGPDAQSVAGAQLAVARAERSLGHYAEATVAARDAVRIYRKNDRKESKHRSEHTDCLHVLAHLLYYHEAGTAEEADEFYRAGIAIRIRMGWVGNTEERTETMTVQLASVLFRTKKLLPARPIGKPEVDLELARYWAGAARALEKRPVPPVEDDLLLKDHLQSVAVRMLRSVRDQGKFEADAIRKSDDFKILIDRADFRELLESPDRKPVDKSN
jgi:serine/threonine protein kinase